MWNLRQLKSLFTGRTSVRQDQDTGSDRANTSAPSNQSVGEASGQGQTRPLHFFLHIPKCGGNTFSDFLSRHFPVAAIYTAEKSTADWQEHQRLKASLKNAENVRQLTQRYAAAIRRHDLVAENHFTWRTLLEVGTDRPVTGYTLLREPRERVASHYLHLRRIPPAPAGSPGYESENLYSLARELPLADFCRRLDRHDVWGTIFNLQTRSLSSHYFGHGNWRQIGEQAILDDVLENLTKIDHLADLADLNEFSQLVSLANHWLPPGELIVHNAGDGPTATADLASQVPEEMVALDQTIYEAGRKQYADWRQRVLHDAALARWQASQPAAPGGASWEIGLADALPGINFHGREGTGADTLRWMGPERESKLFLPVRPGRAHTVAISFVAFLEPDLFPQTVFRINGLVVAPTVTARGGKTIVTLTVPAEQTRSGLVDLRIAAARTTSAEAICQAADSRQKSLAIQSIRMTPQEPVQ